MMKFIQYHMESRHMVGEAVSTSLDLKSSPLGVTLGTAFHGSLCGHMVARLDLCTLLTSESPWVTWLAQGTTICCVVTWLPRSLPHMVGFNATSCGCQWPEIPICGLHCKPPFEIYYQGSPFVTPIVSWHHLKIQITK